jgi:ankyrin repeat protein
MGVSQSVVEEDAEGDLPLLPQLLEAENVDWDLVRRSLRHCPEQSCLYAHGVEPSMLLRAIKRSAPAAVVEMLIESDDDDDAKNQISATGESILHAACDSREVTSLVLKKCPQLASSRDYLGRLPLHLSTSVEAATLLIKAYPAALAARSGECGSLPLHYALAQEHLNADLLRVLADQTLHPLRTGGILARNKHGVTPMKKLIDILELNLQDDLWNLLREWMGRLRRSEPELHKFIECGCCKSQQLMGKALETFSADISGRDEQQRTPLHVAAINGQCDADAFETLMKANPKAPRMTDNDGRLPIDVAAESPYTKPHCLALLMKGEPRAINTRDLKNLYYPFLTSALSTEQNATNTYFLLRARPEVLSYYNTP